MTYKDLRRDAEHDCDRILYSAAFRRLAGVTQVVAVREIQLFHNRLTHTLKVAQLARRLAQALIVDPDNDAIVKADAGPDPDVAEAAALAHDLGHPPFGHIAEAVLDDLCRGCGLDGFEGNAQSLRIVTRLSHRNQPTPGLSLSNKTLNAIMKYPWLREGSYAGKSKWGAYQSERKIFLETRTGQPEEVPCVEAQIMDWADDISYALHDIEDFYRVGLIPLERVMSDEVESQDFIAKASAYLAPRWSAFDPELASRAFRELRPLLVPDSPYRATAQHRQGMHRRTSLFIIRYLSAVRLLGTQPWIAISADAKHEVMMLKQLTWQYVVNSPALATVQEGQKRMIEELFTTLYQWVEEELAGASTHRLPTRLRELYFALQRDDESKGAISAALPAGKTSDEACRARAVADYISSLTEEQAIDLHARLHGGTQSAMARWVFS